MVIFKEKLRILLKLSFKKKKVLKIILNICMPIVRWSADK